MQGENENERYFDYCNVGREHISLEYVYVMSFKIVGIVILDI